MTHNVASVLLVYSLLMALMKQGVMQKQFCHTESGMAST